MLERLRAHLNATRLIPEGARVLVAYSGGADSACLLHLLHACGIDVVAAHLHHGQRPEADDELSRCEAFCQSIDVPFASGRADVPRMASELKIGLEEAGRKARYSFLRQAAFRLGCQLIATGHTRDDHVETVILHLARGAGLQGAAGIAASRDGVVRPLLPFPRTETRAYCIERGLWFHDDPANLDVRYRRNRVRLNVIPELREINPEADAAIARFAEMAEEEDRFLNGAAAAALERAEVPLDGELAFLTRNCEAAFERAALETLPLVLFRRAIRLAVEALGASLDHDQVRIVAESVAAQGTGSITAEGGTVVVEWTQDEITVRDPQPIEPFRYPLTVPGETDSEDFGWVFTSVPGTAGSDLQPRASLEAWIDAGSVRGPLYFRSMQPGDDIRPLGFDGTRKLSDLLSEAGLTRSARARLPIVCDLVGPVWAPGVCLSERVRPQAGKAAIRVQFGPLEPSAAT